MQKYAYLILLSLCAWNISAGDDTRMMRYPDIEVIDRADELAKGNDPSIEKAVEVLLDELKAHPVPEVKDPTPPDRSKWIEKEIK